MSDRSGTTMCYIGRKPCGCAVAASVDIPEMAKDNAKEVAKWIRAGWTIEKQTVQWVRDGGLASCTHEKRRRVERAVQESLGLERHGGTR